MSALLKAQIDKLLSGVASGYFPKNFLCESILPQVQSAQYSGLLGKFGTQHLRIENAVKGGRGKYRQVEPRAYTTTSFVIEGHGLSDIVSKEDYKNYDDPFDAERDGVRALSLMLWLEKEKLLADTLLSTSIITQNVTLSGTSQFSDYNNSDPVGVMSTGINTVLDATGVEPNIAVMDKKTRRKLRYHPQLLDSLGFKYAKPGGLSDDQLAEALGVEKVLVGEARYESAKEGQTSSLASVWGKDIVLVCAPQSIEVGQVSVGYMVRPSGSGPRKVYKQAMFNPPGATEILVEDEYDMLISNASAAYLIKAAIA